MFESMILVLTGQSAKVVQAYEKAVKPYVTGSKIVRKK